ncbi:MAG: sulfatase-like hydrolase/transferase [Isosphaeraceae bacterium]
MRRIRWLTLTTVFASILGGAPAAVAQARRPNVLIILCDDVGYGEFGFQGCKDIPTPNIDSIARNGVRFTQGYNAATYCSPSRAGLLTGRYPTRFGHEFNSVAARMGLPTGETTLADRLRSAGYATCAIGKWHLGGAPAYRPMRRGFDEFFGTLANTPYFRPAQFVDSRLGPDVREVEDPAFYTTEAYARRAVEWLDAHKDRPWFLYLPFNAQHNPLQAPRKYVDRFPQIADERRRTFAAMMSALDDAVGQVLQEVRRIGQEDDTLIAFLSDNGGPTRNTTSSNGPLHGFKATTWEGGIRVPFCMQWKGKLPAGKTYDSPIIQLDLVPTCLAAAGVAIDPAWKLDGVNLLPFLKGDRTDRPHETLFWRFGSQWAIRHGDWKLVVAREGTGKPELYDLAMDIGERHDLAGEQPEKARELKRLWDRWNAEQAPPLVPERPVLERAAAKKAVPRNAAKAAKRAERRAARRAARRESRTGEKSPSPGARAPE